LTGGKVRWLAESCRRRPSKPGVCLPERLSLTAAAAGRKEGGPLARSGGASAHTYISLALNRARCAFAVFPPLSKHHRHHHHHHHIRLFRSCQAQLKQNTSIKADK